MSFWQLETSTDRLIGIRASFPCKNGHLWKRSIVINRKPSLTCSLCTTWIYTRYVRSRYWLVQSACALGQSESTSHIWEAPRGIRQGIARVFTDWITGLLDYRVTGLPGVYSGCRQVTDRLLLAQLRHCYKHTITATNPYMHKRLAALFLSNRPIPHLRKFLLGLRSC